VSIPNVNNAVKSNIIWAIVLFVCFIVAACVTLFIALPDSRNPLSLVSILLGTIPTTTGVIVLLANQGKTIETVDAVNTKVDRVLNGEMQGKIETAVHNVLNTRYAVQPSPDTATDETSNA